MKNRKKEGKKKKQVKIYFEQRAALMRNSETNMVQSVQLRLIQQGDESLLEPEDDFNGNKLPLERNRSKWKQRFEFWIAY